jgi:hypothetical protein
MRYAPGGTKVQIYTIAGYLQPTAFAAVSDTLIFNPPPQPPTVRGTDLRHKKTERREGESEK